MTQQEITKAPVTVLGLGAMGTALAKVLLAAGHPTTVWNRTPAKAEALAEQGAVAARSAAEAVAAAELVIVCLLDYEAVREVLEPLELGGRSVVNLTNGTPNQARSTAAWAAERGAQYVDGGIMAVPPMIGQPGSLILYSGTQPAFEAHREALEVLGEARHLGADHGLAPLYDIALLSGMYGSFIGFLQATALVRSEGVKATDFLDLLGPWLNAMSGSMSAAAAQIDAGDYTGDVSSNLAMQATAFPNLLQTAEQQGISAELLAPLQTLMDARVAAGHGEEGLFGVIEQMKKQVIAA